MAVQQDAEQEGPKLVANGSWVNLGGSRVQVVFDNRALVEIERRWGSLNAFAKELRKGDEGKIYTCVSDAIAATVRNLPVDPVDLIDPSRVLEYVIAIGAAFREAIPTVSEPKAEQGGGRSPDSPLAGDGSSTSGSSAGGWHPPTSGP